MKLRDKDGWEWEISGRENRGLGGGDFGAFRNKTNHWGHSFSVSMPLINALWDKMLI